MKRFTTSFGLTKRKNRYNLRQNKLANGFSRMSADTKRISNPNHPEYDDVKCRILLMLTVYGTTDVLAKRKLGGSLGLAKRSKVEHKTDKGYFKDVIVLSDCGKRLLKQHRNNVHLT